MIAIMAENVRFKANGNSTPKFGRLKSGSSVQMLFDRWAVKTQCATHPARDSRVHINGKSVGLDEHATGHSRPLQVLSGFQLGN